MNGMVESKKIPFDDDEDRKIGDNRRKYLETWIGFIYYVGKLVALNGSLEVWSMEDFIGLECRMIMDLFAMILFL